MRALACVLALVAMGVGEPSAAAQVVDTKTPKPPTQPLPAGAGEPLLAGLQGDVTVVDFWASWCEPCVAALGDLPDLDARVAQAGGKLVAVSIQDGIEAEAARQMFTGRGLYLDGYDPQQAPARLAQQVADVVARVRAGKLRPAPRPWQTLRP